MTDKGLIDIGECKYCGKTPPIKHLHWPSSLLPKFTDVTDMTEAERDEFIAQAGHPIELRSCLNPYQTKDSDGNIEIIWRLLAYEKKELA